MYASKIYKFYRIEISLKKIPEIRAKGDCIKSMVTEYRKVLTNRKHEALVLFLGTETDLSSTEHYFVQKKKIGLE